MAFIRLNKANYFANLASLQKKAKSLDRLILVLKDNAYGHGLKEISNLAFEYGVRKIALKNLADASLVEAEFEDILLLSHVPNGLENAPDKKANLSFAINSLEAIEDFAFGSKVYLKVDTGMHRNGICPKDIKQALKLIKKANLDLKGAFTHFASTNTQASQMQVFKKIKSELKAQNSELLFHSFNSQAIFNKSLPDDELCRIGLAQFGYNSLNDSLKPVLSLWAEKLSSRILKKGECVGYEARFCSLKDMQVSCYDLGYGDGLFRYDARGELALANGQKLIGVMSMDSFSIEGSEPLVCVFEDARGFASFFDTIVYEVLVKLNASIKRIVV